MQTSRNLRQCISILTLVFLRYTRCRLCVQRGLDADAFLGSCLVDMYCRIVPTSQQPVARCFFSSVSKIVCSNMHFYFVLTSHQVDIFLPHQGALTKYGHCILRWCPYHSSYCNCENLRLIESYVLERTSL